MYLALAVLIFNLLVLAVAKLSIRKLDWYNYVVILIGVIVLIGTPIAGLLFKSNRWASYSIESSKRTGAFIDEYALAEPMRIRHDSIAIDLSVAGAWLESPFAIGKGANRILVSDNDIALRMEFHNESESKDPLLIGFESESGRETSKRELGSLKSAAMFYDEHDLPSSLDTLKIYVNLYKPDEYMQPSVRLCRDSIYLYRQK